jgi:hypothetical protein
VAAKKHSSRKKSGKSARTGARLSGNPQLRAKQLQERANGYASSQRDSDWEATIPLAGRLPASVATGRDNWNRPAPWWPQSHERILDRVRTAGWPADPLAVETLAAQIVGDELFMRMSTHGVTGVYPFQWMAALVEATSAGLKAAITAGPAGTAEGAADWPKLWAFLTGLWDRSIPGTLGKAAALLAGQAATAGHAQAENAAPAPVAHVQETGDILSARDTYGSRVLLTADFTLLFPNDPASSAAQPHCYAWDVDWCVAGTVVGAGVFQGAAEALTWWRAQVGPAAGEAALTTPRPLEFLRLLQPALAIGTLLDAGIVGDEPREVMREYYRLHVRAVAVAAHFKDEVDKAGQSPDPDETGEELTEAFLAWHAANAGPGDPAPAQADTAEAGSDPGTGDDGDYEELSTSEALEIILATWGPIFSPADVYYTCSPHRIEATATAIRADYDPEDAAPALRLLPAWTDWCLTRHQTAPAPADRSRAAARSHSALTDPFHGPAPEVSPYHRTE